MAKQNLTLDSYVKILDELKNKIFKPIYFLTGDEAYYIDKISDYISDNVLTEEEKAFNQSIIYGKDISVADVINSARRFPMSSNYQVIIVKEAQNIKNLSELEIYLKAPQPSTILVICHKPKSDGKGKSDRLTKVTNLVKQKGVFFESKKLYDYQIPDWIINYLKQKGIKIDLVAANLLNEYLGNDLSKISHELEKLIITLPPDNKQITSQNIEQNIGISKDFNRFELTKALGEKNVLKANRIVDYFAHNANANPFVLTISAIHQYFVKIFRLHFLKDKSKESIARELGINPFFTGEYENAIKKYDPKKCIEIFAILRDYDMRSKGVNNNTTDHGELLRELVFKILH
ncbi:DNA polymerase III subunit delta [Tenuifilaceae bacterium CYCD]|nr:DNA polymerase III subunit delta [Tenuifilaceae bacterium CYCD]